MPDVNAIARILADAEKRAQKWASQDIRAFGSVAALMAALSVRETPEEEAELRSALVELATAYLDSSAEQRGAIRAMFDHLPTVRKDLPSIGQRLADGAQVATDVDLIRLGLALVSINDLRSDSRDVQVALSGIVAAAQRANIDPRPILRGIANLSNSKRNDPLSSMQELLVEFSEG